MQTVLLCLLGWIAANLIIGAVWTAYCLWPRRRDADAHARVMGQALVEDIPRVQAQSGANHHRHREAVSAQADQQRRPAGCGYFEPRCAGYRIDRIASVACARVST